MRHMYELRTIDGSYVGMVFAEEVVTDESRTKFIVADKRWARTVLVIWNDRMTYAEVK